MNSLLTEVTMLDRPDRSECEAYYFTYIDQVPEMEVLDLLATQRREFPAFVRGIDAARLDRPYAPGKWTIKEIVGHLIDSERAFSHRAFCSARLEPADQPSFDQDAYVASSRYDRRPIDEILGEYAAVRTATLALFESFDDEDWTKVGRASGFRFSVRTFPFIVAGHEIHHRKVIEERYLE